MKSQPRTSARTTQRDAVTILGTVLCLVGSYGLFTSTARAAAHPVPFIDSMSPLSAAPGGSGFTLTVYGAGFVNGVSQIYWNGAALSGTTTCTATQCSAPVPAANIATQGSAAVTVEDSSQSGAVSNVLFFPIIGSTPALSFSRTDFAVGNSPTSVAVADFNGDGFLDLAVVNSGDNTVSILLGNGDGTFKAQTTFATGIQPVSVAVGDFDNSGHLSLAVVNACGNSLSCTTEGTVSILLGNGTGNFTLAASSPSTGYAPNFVAAGDFNKDGNLDLAVVNGCGNTVSCTGPTPGTVSILLGDGTGKFTLKSSPGTDDNPSWAAVGDFDNSGNLSLAVANAGTTMTRGTTVTVMIGKGDGTFSTSSISSQGVSPVAVAVGDFNGDGKLDLAVANACGTNPSCSSAGGVAILLGNGKGVFTFQSNTAAGSGPTALAVADLNADGKLDVAVADGTGSTVSVLLGDGAGNLSLQTSPASPSTGSAPSSIAIGDFNGDGGPDLVTANKNAANVSVLLEAPTATLACGSSEPTGTTCTVPAPPSLPSPSLSFGSEPVGSMAGPMTVTLTNGSNLTLTITSLAVTSSASNFSIDSGKTTCGVVPFVYPLTLEAGANCIIGVDFTPQSQGGLGGVIQIADNAPGSPQNIDLSGTGTAALATVSPTSLTFTNVTVGTTSAVQPVTLTNTGTGALTGIMISFTGPNASEFSEMNTCGTSIGASSSCTISVSFKPSVAGAGTPQTATLSIADTSGTQALTQSVALTGTGIAPIATASPGMLSFPNQLLGTTSVAQTVNLSNSGAGALDISSISIGGTNASEFGQTNDCGSSVPGYGNCTISVTFTPPITPAPNSAPQSATLTISDNSISGGVSTPTQTVSLSGTWVAPVASPSPTSLTFNQVFGSTSAPQTATLSNTGTATLTINSIGISGANASEFAETMTCLASLAASSSCTISVTFTASTAGPAAATLTITDNTNEVAGSTQTVSLTGTGTKSNTLSTIISNTPNPSIVGLPVMVSFTVAAVAPGIGTPTGTVTITDGPDSCTGTLTQGAGNCSLTPSLSPPGGPGLKSLTATYHGDSNFNTGTSASVSQTVIKANTSTMITSNVPNPSTVGLPVTVTFTVAPSPPGVGTPTGMVTVSDGTGDSCTGSLTAGAGSCSMPILTPSSPGGKPLTASYAGDTNFNPSVSPSVAQTVIKANTTTTITSVAPSSVVVGQPVTVSFTVTPPAGDILTPTGTVTVSDGAGDSCIGTLSSSPPDVGIGSCTFVPSSPGTKTITASYPGDSNFNPSVGTTNAGNALGVVDFSISVSPTTEVISSGHTATYTLTLNSLGGFAGTVGLSCTDPQPKTTCSVSPTSVTVGGTITSTISVVAAKAAAHGTFTLTFTGVYGSGIPASGGLTHSTNAFLTIK